MNRKEFLVGAGFAALIAATGAPAWASQAAPAEFKSVWADQADGTSLHYEASLTEATVLQPTAGTLVELPILVTRLFPDGKTHVGTYLFRQDGAVEGTAGVRTLRLKRISISGVDTVKRAMPGRLEMTFRAGQGIDLSPIGGARVTLVRMADPTMACFLTTACTAARGLPDECEELATLRALRDEEMLPTKKGAALVADYYRIAPGLVTAIDALPNRAVIWNYVYETLVLPSVSLVREGRPAEAQAHYAAYVNMMQDTLAG